MYSPKNKIYYLLHQSASTTKPVTVEVKNTDHLTTGQHSTHTILQTLDPGIHVNISYP